jgi:hypothetical protein
MRQHGQKYGKTAQVLNGLNLSVSDYAHLSSPQSFQPLFKAAADALALPS